MAEFVKLLGAPVPEPPIPSVAVRPAATQVFIDERMDKMCYIHYTTFNGIRGDYYSALISKEILPWVTTWLNVEVIMLREKGQLQKDKHYLIPLI